MNGRTRWLTLADSGPGSAGQYVYVGGLPSWYLAKLKVSHLIFRLPRIFSKCLRLLCFDFRDCCRELYFYSINLLLTLDPHAMPRWKLHLLTEWRSVAIFNILAKTKVCELVWELYQALGEFRSGRFPPIVSHCYIQAFIQASNCVPLLPNCFGYKAIPAFGPDERNEMEYKMETSGTKHETTFAFNHKFNFGQFALLPPPQNMCCPDYMCGQN